MTSDKGRSFGFKGCLAGGIIFIGAILALPFLLEWAAGRSGIAFEYGDISWPPIRHEVAEMLRHMPPTKAQEFRRLDAGDITGSCPRLRNLLLRPDVVASLHLITSSDPKEQVVLIQFVERHFFEDYFSNFYVLPEGADSVGEKFKRELLNGELADECSPGIFLKKSTMIR